MAVTPTEAQWPELRRVARTIVVVDLVESVRLMEQDEEGTVRRWQSFVGNVVNSLLPQHRGRLVKSLGDGLMVEFESGLAALQCAKDMLSAIATLNASYAEDRYLRLRIGAHAADVIVSELDIYGSGVNLAARLATLGRPDDIIVSVGVRDALVPGLDGEFEDLGDCYLKHVAGPTRAYRAIPHVPPMFGELHHASALPVDDLRPTLAVIPLDAGLGADGALADVVTDELSHVLSRTSDVSVISRLSTMGLRGRTHSVSSLAMHLGVHYVVSGTCRASGGWIITHIELSDTQTGHVIASDTARGSIDDLLAGNGDLPAALGGSVLKAVVDHEIRRARSFPVPSLEGHTLLLGAITLLHRNSLRDSDQSKELLEAVIERYPRHPGARAWLAKWHVLRAHQGWSPDPARSASMARDCANRALDLDPENSLALTIDGLVRVQFEKNLGLAEQSYSRALGVNPNDSLAWLLKGALHAFRGEGKEAVDHTQRALQLSPLDPLKYYFESLAATAAAAAGDYERATTLAQHSLRGNCTHTSTLRTLAISQSMLGRMDEARQTVDRLLALEPQYSVSQFRARSPSGAFAIGRTFAEALKAAGVPE